MAAGKNEFDTPALKNGVLFLQTVKLLTDHLEHVKDSFSAISMGIFQAPSPITSSIQALLLRCGTYS